MKKINVFILGAGGHSKVLIDCLRTADNIHILGILDINSDLHNKQFCDLPILGNDQEILKKYSPETIQLVNGIGSTGLPSRRVAIFEQYKKLGYQFLTIVHPTAYFAKGTHLGEGAQLMAGSIVQPGCIVGSNVIINTKTTIDHDCVIEDHVHLAPGVTCCGNVTIGAQSHVGCGATLLQGITIGERCLIAAGGVVVRDMIVGSKVAGVPAKIME